jgi:hypothetical protein
MALPLVADHGRRERSDMKVDALATSPNDTETDNLRSLH